MCMERMHGLQVKALIFFPTDLGCEKNPTLHSSVTLVQSGVLFHRAVVEIDKILHLDHLGGILWSVDATLLSLDLTMYKGGLAWLDMRSGSFISRVL